MVLSHMALGVLDAPCSHIVHRENLAACLGAGLSSELGGLFCLRFVVCKS